MKVMWNQLVSFKRERERKKENEKEKGRKKKNVCFKLIFPNNNNRRFEIKQFECDWNSKVR